MADKNRSLQARGPGPRPAGGEISAGDAARFGARRKLFPAKRRIMKHESESSLRACRMRFYCRPGEHNLHMRGTLLQQCCLPIPKLSSHSF